MEQSNTTTVGSIATVASIVQNCALMTNMCVCVRVFIIMTVDFIWI